MDESARIAKDMAAAARVGGRIIVVGPRGEKIEFDKDGKLIKDERFTPAPGAVVRQRDIWGNVKYVPVNREQRRSRNIKRIPGTGEYK